ncbi:hypothetical protein J2X97_003355 [Epilithonimonas hungarica]|uniref:T9SS type A sorting domain-containing protein n=1 Tax=Epilithonimonas hungarica TaxID=454006 RepID=UPI002788B1BC|nr:T9SS type A sorting domain-containing protein [Epilithonimonas hungarica]MDP9957683.1 hypothetical protein [Epilithonimonas hungarica]
MKKYFILLISFFSVIIPAQNVNADVLEINYQSGLNPSYLFKYKDKILFAGDNVNGKKNVIWGYDNSSMKSYPVREIVTGWSSLFDDDPYFSELKDKVYFLVRVSSNYELWITDATNDGTHKILELPEVTYIYEMKTFDNKILFIKTNKGIFLSDGSTAGTKKITEITTEVAAGTEFYKDYIFFAAKNANYSNEMWASSGIDTFRILDSETNTPIYVYQETFGYNVGNKFIFYARSGNGLKDGLWEFDNDSKKATYIAESRNFSGGVLLNNKLIYKAWDSQYGGRIWVSDGTSQNTFPLNSQNQFIASMSNQNFLMKNGNNVYFFPRIGNWNRLWKTDGTIEGTVATDIVIDNNGPDFEKSFPINKKLVIRSSNYNQYWLLDESENIIPINNKFDFGIEESGKIIFPYTNKKFGNELFQYNFATNSIDIFHDGRHSSGSNPSNFEISRDNKLVFTASNTESGNEFYLIENKNDIPKLIKDFDYNGDYSYGIPNGKLFKVGNYHYQKPNSYAGVLAKSDGTAENTQMLTFPGNGNDRLNDNSSFGNLNDNTLIILTYSSDNERKIKIWKVDNNQNVITLIKEISTSVNVHNGKNGIYYDGYLYFTVENQNYKTEIWRTDGTSENTTLAPFSIPDMQYYNNIPEFITVFDNKLLINKDNKLWTYDGATQMVKEITIPADSYPYTVQFNISKNTKIIDGKLYIYSQYNNSVYQFQNFNTQPVSVLNNNGSAFFSTFEKCGNSIYLAAGTSENNYDSLWSFDSQSNLSNLVYTNNYSGINRAKNLTCVNNFMYYTRDNSNKIFRTNGTQQSILTIDVTIDNAGQLDSTDTIDDMFSFDGHLYFVATTKESGKELFRINTNLPTFLMTQDYQNFKKSNIVISPNPTAEFVKINSTSNINKVELYDYSGIKISESKSDNIDFSQLNSGVYLVKIYTDDFIETKKVIKK